VELRGEDRPVSRYAQLFPLFKLKEIVKEIVKAWWAENKEMWWKGGAPVVEERCGLFERYE
jgi:hypothetical protein